MQAIDIACRVDRVDDALRSHLRWQRHLDQYAVNLRVIIEPAQEGENGGFRRVRREPMRLHVDADRGCGAIFISHINRARWVIADQHHSEAGTIGQGGHRLACGFTHAGSDRASIDDRSAQRTILEINAIGQQSEFDTLDQYLQCLN